MNKFDELDLRLQVETGHNYWDCRTALERSGYDYESSVMYLEIMDEILSKLEPENLTKIRNLSKDTGGCLNHCKSALIKTDWNYDLAHTLILTSPYYSKYTKSPFNT